MASVTAFTLTTYLLQAVGNVLLAAVMLRFWQLYRRDYLRNWGWSWLAQAVYHLLVGLGVLAAAALAVDQTGM